jgi:hypothetical protein
MVGEFYCVSIDMHVMRRDRPALVGFVR